MIVARECDESGRRGIGGTNRNAGSEAQYGIVKSHEKMLLPASFSSLAFDFSFQLAKRDIGFDEFAFLVK